MPTLAQVSAAATTLSAIATAQTVALVRGSARFQGNPGLYPNLESKLEDVTTVQAQQINAALTLLDTVGDGTVALTGGDEGVDYSQERDREQLINYVIDVLYQSPVLRSGIGVAAMNSVAYCARCKQRVTGCWCV